MTELVSDQVLFDILLAADDDEDALRVENCLNGVESLGRHARVWRATRFQQTLHVISSRRIECVLLDLNLPGAHGLAGLRRLRQVAPHLPVIVLTGADETFVDGSADALSVHDFLSKTSLDSAQLHRAISTALARMFRRATTDGSRPATPWLFLDWS